MSTAPIRLRGRSAIRSRAATEPGKTTEPSPAPKPAPKAVQTVKAAPEKSKEPAKTSQAWIPPERVEHPKRFRKGKCPRVPGAVNVASPTWSSPFRTKEINGVWHAVWIGSSWLEQPPDWQDVPCKDRQEAAQFCLVAFEAWLKSPDQAEARKRIKTRLRGYNLCCVCPTDWPCHADVLLELANEGEAPQCRAE